MPHCIIEYSTGLAKFVTPSKLVSVVHAAAHESGLFVATDIRSRALAFDGYKIRTDKEYFLHVTAKIMSGRNQEQKQKLSQKIMAALEKLDLESIILSVQICDIDKNCYAKTTI